MKKLQGGIRRMNGTMKKTVLLATVTLMFVSNAFAIDWKHLGSDGKGNHYFFKPKTYAMSKDKIASSWTKVEYKVDVAGLMQKKVTPDEYTGSSSTVVYEKYNCIDRKKMTIVGKHYDGKDDNDVAKTGWTAVQPGSIDEGLLTALCKDGGNKKEESRAPAKK
jgi:hypothetical protein